MKTEIKFKKSDVAWLERTISLLNEGGVWGIPRNSSVWVFHKEKKQAVLKKGDPNNVDNLTTKAILEHLKWEVITNDEE